MIPNSAREVFGMNQFSSTPSVLVSRSGIAGRQAARSRSGRRRGPAIGVPYPGINRNAFPELYGTAFRKARLSGRSFRITLGVREEHGIDRTRLVGLRGARRVRTPATPTARRRAAQR